MPVTYTKDKNGRWVSSGSVTAQDAEPLAGPVGFGGDKPKPKRKPAGEARPWYWHLTPQGLANNLRYEAKRHERFNRPLPGEKPQVSRSLGGIGGMQLRSIPASPAFRYGLAGVVAKAPADAALAVVNLLQRAEKFGKNPKNPLYLKMVPGASLIGGLFESASDPEVTAVGRQIVRAQRAATRAVGARLPEQVNPEDRFIQDTTAGFAANVAVAPFTAGAGGAAARLVPGLGAKLAKAGLDPRLVRVLASSGRWGAGLAADETVANLLTDNTQGGASQLIKATGAPWPDALTADPKRDDRISAALRETPASMAFAAGLGALGGAMKGTLSQAPHVARALRENRAAQEMRRARAKTVENGLQRENPDTGEHEFTPAATTPPPPPPPPPARPAARTPGEYDAELLDSYRQKVGGGASADQPAPSPAPARPIPTRESSDYTDFGKALPGPLPGGGDPRLDPWQDDAAYQSWLRRNSSMELAPTRQSEAAPAAAPLPRQTLPQRDELRGEGLADPWGMGPDPSSPVQQALGQKAGVAAPQDPGPAPVAKESSAPEGEFFDPELPEIDHAALALDRLDPEVVSRIAQTPGPVLPQIEEALASRQPVAPRPELTAADVVAPTEKLADNRFITRREEWGNLRDNELLGVFHPEVNPGLFGVAHARTGRSFEELTREDALETLSALAEGGATVMPGRLSAGIELARTSDLGTDPVRFQYKMNTDRRGVQKGNSLEGLEQWNTAMEGSLLVWTDPADGKTYVVNGHNRLAKAIEMGIPTLPVKRLLAKTAEQARALGALDNIGSGGGTPWDAARFFREAGILDESQASQAGIPLKSEHKIPQRGLQLAQLPDNIFQAGLTGELPEPRALALGGSGLSPEKMQSVWSEFQTDTDFRSEGGFQELIDFARGTPTTAVDSGGRLKQGEIPGLEGGSRDLTKTKLKLAREIGKALRVDKRALKGASRNADILEAKGNNQIDAQASMRAGMDTERLGLVFNQLKYQGGNEISRLLNEGAEEIAAGAKVSVVARRIQGELAQAAEKVVMPSAPEAPAPAIAAEATATEAPRPRTEQDALADQLLVLNRAAAQGEVRPSATPIPEPPVPPEIEAPRASARGINAEDVTNSAEALKLAQQQRQAALDGGDTAAAQAWDAEIRRISQGRLAADEARRNATQTGLFGVEEFDSSMPLFDQSKLDAEEARLEGEYLERDTAMQQEMARAERVATGYEEKTFDQKVAEHGIAEGWEMPESAPPQKLSSVDPEDIDEILESRILPEKLQKILKEELIEIIRRVAGDDAMVRFEKLYHLSEVPPEWGGKPGEEGLELGFYQQPQARIEFMFTGQTNLFVDDLIQINGVGTMAGLLKVHKTAFHEAWHRIQHLALNEDQAKVLNSTWARLKMAIAAGHYPSSQGISYTETQAVAVQNYAYAKFTQKDPVSYILQQYRWPQNGNVAALARAFFQGVDTVLDFGEKAWNALSGNGFISTKSIIEDFYSGRLVRKDGLEIDYLRYSAAPLRNHTKTGWSQTTWSGQKVGQFDQAIALSSVLREADDGRTKGASGRAWRLAESGEPEQALRELIDYADRRVADLDAEIESIKQRATNEGC